MSVPTPAAGSAAGHASATLLLVDDEPSVLSALRRLFRPQGYDILQAGSGAEALELMTGQHVDIVISDMRMPGMDGAALLEQVRQRQPGAVRILLTGYSDIGSTVAAINRGEIHRYIAKPWDDNDLLLVVAEALKRRQLEHENAQLLDLAREQNDQLQQLNRTLEARVEERTQQLQARSQELEQAHEELNASFMLTVKVFSGLLEMRQDGIAGHARRVGDLAGRIAAQMGLDDRTQRDVQLAGLLHDIGKVGYSDGMLSKPVSKFSADEAMHYQRHPLDGEAVLMPLEQFHDVAIMVRQHHERVDGRGFPDGLSGHAIALGARVLAVAADYDDLVHGGLAERVYTPAQARAAITGGRGTHYDAQVVAALMAVLDAIDAEATAEVEVEVRDLMAGMVLSRDLLSPQGAILLPQGHRFDARMIAKLVDFASRGARQMLLPVLKRTVPAKAPSPHAHPHGRDPAARPATGSAASTATA